MATAASILSRVRLELGDLPERFRTTLDGNGEQDDFDLNGRNLDPTSIQVYTVNPDNTQSIIPSADYVVDSSQGRILFDNPLDQDEHVIVEANTYGLFNDAELGTFVDEALNQHLVGRTVTHRYRDGHGFIRYDRQTMDITNLPSVEQPLVAMLAAIEALWALSTDASMDIDVSTSEGTQIPRGQRFRQIVEQITNLTEKYETLSLALGVGLFAPEVINLRRISRQTGRLVPIFVPREYDETGPPVRVVPPVGRRFEDPDGPASPWYPTGFGS